MSTEQTLSGLKAIVVNLVNNLIEATGKGAITWKTSMYLPKDLEPSSRIIECYEGSMGNTGYYIYKRARESQQRVLGSSAPPLSENILEVRVAEDATPVRMPYIPKTDELILAAQRSAFETNISVLTKILSEFSEKAHS